MNPYARLRQEIARAAQELKRNKSTDPIRIIGHLDADGISASAILVKALMRLSKRYQLYTIQQLDSITLEMIDKQGNGPLICVDIGSGQFSTLRNIVRKTRCIVLDHHELEEETKAENIIHINPHLFGINGSKEISGAGIAYLFAEALDENNMDLSYLGIVGAVGDGQDLKSELLKDILDKAKKSGMIEESYGIKLYGATTRPLHKVLEWSSDHPIPGLTGSENNCLAFLHELGIKSREGNKWRSLSDLSEEEHQKLITGIIIRRSKHKDPYSILGKVYYLSKEPIGHTRDVREFCTLLNACGRLNKASLGLGACLGDEKLKKKAIAQVEEYKKHVSEMMRWYETAKEEIKKEKGILIINAQDAVMQTMIGTLCSIVARSGKIEDGTVVIGLSRMPARLTKVSMRLVGSGHDLFRLATVAAEKVGGQAGGHKEAAGAIIPTISEGDFIRIATERIQRKR
ncbi:MAG: DHH family phosphoesterase [Nanoarchaeota archaeon]|nr:MAG: DHH family phosphoesterase [Nanoarchaeota archaeon]